MPDEKPIALIDFHLGDTQLYNVDMTQVLKIELPYFHNYHGRFFSKVDIGRDYSLVLDANDDHYGTRTVLENKNSLFKVHTREGLTYVAAEAIDPATIGAVPTEEASDVKTEFMLWGKGPIGKSNGPQLMQVVESKKTVRKKIETHLNAETPVTDETSWLSTKETINVMTFDGRETESRNVIPQFIRKVGEPYKACRYGTRYLVNLDIGATIQNIPGDRWKFGPWEIEPDKKSGLPAILNKKSDFLELNTEKGSIRVNPSAINPLTVKDISEGEDSTLNTEFKLYGKDVIQKQSIVQVKERPKVIGGALKQLYKPNKF